MSCTTILVGKNASCDGSTIMARNDDSGGNTFKAKKFVVVLPENQPVEYKSVLSGVKIELPGNPLRYNCVPNAFEGEGIWGEAGFNEANVAMTETETITSNARVLGADPLVKEGIGEEDLLTITLPYIKSAREGVMRLGQLHEKYGTYEMNGIGFQDKNEIWWFESIGGHHWIARRVPDDSYVVVPNQLGIDWFNLKDALGEQKDHMCSSDLVDFISKNHLDCTVHQTPLCELTDFDVRAAFGSHADSDHIYNTPRAWFMERYLNPRDFVWEGPDADYTPESDDLPWSLVPEHLVTVEDVKYVLSSYFQGTDFNPYGRHGDPLKKGMYRPIGVNRNCVLVISQVRPYVDEKIAAVEWVAFGCNAFNQVVPFYANVKSTPEYVADTTTRVTSENFYWANRLIAALSDAHFAETAIHIERYQNKVASSGHNFLNVFDAEYAKAKPADVCKWLEKCNSQISDFVKTQTDALLDQVLYASSLEMKNAFKRSDA